LSFVLVGLLVATFVFLAALASLRIHRWWKTRALPSADRMTGFVTAAIMTEIGIFSVFLVWALSVGIEAFGGSLALPSRAAIWVGTLIPVILASSRIRSAQKRRLAPVMGDVAC